MTCFTYFTNNLFLLKITSGEVFLLPEKIQAKSQLLSCFSHALKFPYYFGENLDALYDCLVDLSWIKEKKIYIIHYDIPLNTLEIEAVKYIKLLSDVTIFWKNNAELELNILFPENCKNKIEQFLSEE